jgi:hypothetical protein
MTVNVEPAPGTLLADAEAAATGDPEFYAPLLDTIAADEARFCTTGGD